MTPKSVANKEKPGSIHCFESTRMLPGEGKVNITGISPFVMGCSGCQRLATNACIDFREVKKASLHNNCMRKKSTSRQGGCIFFMSYRHWRSGKIVRRANGKPFCLRR